MRRSVCNAVLVIAALAAASASAQPASKTPVVTFTGNYVSATNVTPNGEVAFFGFGFVPQMYSREVARFAAVQRDETRRGDVRFDAGRTIPIASIWAVVDVTTGRTSISAPPGFQFTRTDAPRAGMHRAADGSLDDWESGRGWVEVLCVRPGVGAWRGTIIDGDRGDADGVADQRIHIASSRLTALGSSPAAPKRFTPGDTLILIDPMRMEVFSTEVVR